MMIIRYLLIATLAFKSAHSWRTTSRSPRIIGGKRVSVEEIPYIVNIRNNGSFHCGGSLITSKCVITAAHCVKHSNAKDLVVRAGVTFLKERLNKRIVKRIVKHPKYVSKTIDYDVALLELAKPLNGVNIKLIKPASSPPPVGATVRVSGWGLERENGYDSEQLKSVQLEVISREKCSHFYKDYRNVSNAMFCAFVPGVRDACLGDSGGPAVFDNRLVGIVSWGRGKECARPRSPGVYVNVAHVKPWLDNVITKYC
ncbi:hypodermin-A-like [Musca autumnalis]|uniref:hypodermin-A-like n=1 Tax=Musca autumnalis TaxID=221902 RepID=UPI003CED2980